MKKTVSILISAILAACLLLGACSGSVPDATQSGQTSPEERSEPVSEEISEPVSEPASAQESEEESFEGSSEESSEPDPSALFFKEATELLAKDWYLTELIIMGGIRVIETIDDPFALQPLSQDNPYHDSSVLKAELESVYTEEAISEILAYPMYGAPLVSIDGPVTRVSAHFCPAAESPQVVPNAVIESFSELYAAVSVPDLNGETHLIGFVPTENGWRMERSYFFSVHDQTIAPELSASNTGSAASVPGKCLIINLFIDDGESSWTDGEIDTVLGLVDTAASFIKSSSGSYGAGFEYECTDRSASLRLATDEKLPSDMENYVRFDLLFAGTVFGSLKNYAASYFDLEKYDNYCVLIHLNKKGRSYSLRSDTANFDREFYSCERAVTYYSADAGYEYRSTASLYAHEILHLFGANDLYGESVTAEQAAAIAHYYPNDIMAGVSDDIEMLGVSAVTAYAAGMLSRLPEQFAMFFND